MGTGTLGQVVEQKVRRRHPNDIRDATYQDWVPRNTSGIATDNAGSIGTSLLRWANFFMTGFDIQDGVSETNINADAAHQFQIGGVDKVIIDTNGLDGAGLKTASVPKNKHVAVGQQISSSSGSFSTTSTSFVDVTNLSVTITTDGRPVRIFLIPDSVSTASMGISTANGGNPFQAEFKILRDAVNIGVQFVAGQTGTASENGVVLVPVTGFSYFDVVVAGTYTYKVQARAQTGSSPTVSVANAKLVAYQL